MLTVGSMVHYGIDGVCCIMGSVEKKFDGSTDRYLELRPFYRKNDSIFLPENNEFLLTRVRPLVSREEIADILRQPVKDVPWIEAESERKELFKLILWSGDLSWILGLIRALDRRKQQLAAYGKKLRSSDAAFLKDAERLLHEEFAYVLDIPPREVPAYIESQIQ